MVKATDTAREPAAKRRPAKTAADLRRENAALRLELAQSREQQTATSDILRVIASSPAEIGRVLDMIARTTTGLFEGSSAGIRLVEGDFLRYAGAAGEIASRLGTDLPEVRIDRNAVTGRAALEKRQIQIEDTGEASHELAFPESAGRAGFRTLVATPMLREGETVGVITVYRADARPLAEKELQLLRSFADQAVISIENARLLEELQARNLDLTEALENQTATADILRAIASAPEEADQVLQKIIETTAQLFGAASVNVRLRGEDDVLRVVGSGGVSGGQILARIPAVTVDDSTLPGAVVFRGQQIHVPDVERPEPWMRDWPGLPIGRDAGARSVVGTPLKREGQAIGVMTVMRHEPKPFTDKELDQLANFADQAVIAIENARLLDELKLRNRDLAESLEQQSATSDILRAIATTPGDAQRVMQVIAENAARLCKAVDVNIYLPVDGRLQLTVCIGAIGALGPVEVPIGPGSAAGTAFAERRIVDVADMTKRLAEFHRVPPEPARRAPSVLAVPMVRGDVALGVIIVVRGRVQPFTEEHKALMTSFADQAVIAIENARLLSELRLARESAEGSLAELKAAQASLVQAEKMASLGQLTAGIAHEIKNPLNFVNNFAGLSVELLDELKQTAAPVFSRAGPDELAEVDEILGMLTGNLEKIAEHGGRADGIVRSMLAHSRGGSGERRDADVNGLVEEALNLAYHGARAQDQDFNVAMERDLDPSMAPLKLVPQELTRVFLNLFANGFYAADKRRKEGGDPAFGPVLKVATRDHGGAVEVRIRDNGVGIPTEHKARLFEPFFTTKPTGEGTGLGLSISYDIVTQQHGGSIAVESEPGAFTEFTITLPRRAAPAAGADRSVGE